MIGLLDPSIVHAQTRAVTDADLQALDLIGEKIMTAKPSC